MNKKYISLGALIAIAVIWLVGPIVTVEFFGVSSSATALDLLDGDEFGIADILILGAPIAAIVMGLIGIFAKPALTKLGAIIGCAGYVIGIALYLIVEEFPIDMFGWGVWAMIVILAANLVLSLKSE